MSRFFFDYRTATSFSRDEIGVDFGSTEEAAAAARRALAEASADDVVRRSEGARAIDVRDTSGAIVLTIVSTTVSFESGWTEKLAGDPASKPDDAQH